MGYHLVPVPFIIVLIVFYKIYRDKNDLRKIGVIQPLITCLSISICLLGFLTPGFKPYYSILVLLGLTLSVIADFVLVDVKDAKRLTMALVLFLLIYISYIAAITVEHGLLMKELYFALASILIAAFPMAYLWKGLGALRIPVLMYVLLLCLFITRSISTFFNPQFSFTQSALITAASCMFFIGDLELAISSFKQPIPLYIGPVTYAASQMLMALSACYFPY